MDGDRQAERTAVGRELLKVIDIELRPDSVYADLLRSSKIGST